MVCGKVKSFFLNELDGLVSGYFSPPQESFLFAISVINEMQMAQAKNNGILTIASTNHPEDIDDAILNRPSRFDTKLTYNLPTRDLRKIFALKWLSKIKLVRQKNLTTFEQDDNELAETIADKTEGWSFAFLKELCVSRLPR
jgi:SpoVK/Ycf46/Vps4 family AAA+-type ATPase